jgi:hypothetical protein
MEDLLEEIGKELQPARARETYTTLNKILGNIVQNPTEPKFRSLKKSNKMMSEKVCSSPHACSLLLAIGFDDTGEAYVCPGDADLEPMRTSVDLIAGILVSMEDIEPDVPDAKATAVAVTATTAAVTAAAVMAKSSAPKSTVAETPQGFKRRDDVEAKRQEQMDQLQQARAAQKAQYAENPTGPVYTPPPVAAANGYTASTTEAAKKKAPTAFDFQDRGKKEREKEQASQGLADIRALQKEKFKDFKADPNAPLQEAYKAPPSVAGNATTDSSGGWFGGWFGGGGGGSSSNSSSKPERRGPNIKGVGDLPKPVRRG